VKSDFLTSAFFCVFGGPSVQTTPSPKRSLFLTTDSTDRHGWDRIEVIDLPAYAKATARQAGLAPYFLYAGTSGKTDGGNIFNHKWTQINTNSENDESLSVLVSIRVNLWLLLRRAVRAAALKLFRLSAYAGARCLDSSLAPLASETTPAV